MNSPIGTPLQRAIYWCVWAMLGIPWTLMFRWRLGFRDLPKDRPYLLLGNHTSAFDPVWVAYWIGRRASFMASAHVFHVPVLRRILPWVGAFPKAKFVKDRESMELLAARYQAGEVIVLFPEGMRTWDGRPRPVLPGIGRLIKRLNATVVIGKIHTGHLFQPRWARYPRWVPIEVDYTTIDFDPALTAAEINARVQTAIEIDLDRPIPRWSFGFLMAHGLPDYLWACPQCLALESLEVDRKHGSRVRCRACASAWDIDLASHMHGEHATTVPAAMDRIHEHFGAPAIADPARFAATGIALGAEAGTLLKLARGKPAETLASGPVTLTPTALTVGDRVCPLGDLKGVSVEIKNTLAFRAGDDMLMLMVPGHSPLKWGHFLSGWADQESRGFAEPSHDHGATA